MISVAEIFSGVFDGIFHQQKYFLLCISMTYRSHSLSSGSEMRPALEEIPARILFLAKGALAQTNKHAAYYHQYEARWMN
ncbi:hypothetical protein [Methylocystis sp.]|uniref:hypothetical protein n=1 Tax=Methylocystis sp. TaxID=1911079 RepID=UPI003D1257D2